MSRFGALAAAMFALLVTLSSPSPAAAVDWPAKVAADALVGRLNLMPEVAYAKYCAHLPIDDPAREAEQQAAFVERARDAGVDPRFAAAVIRDQFAAARSVQYKMFHAWNSGAVPLPSYRPLDLASELRPMINTANDRLLAALVAVGDQRKQSSWTETFDDATSVASQARRVDVGSPEIATAAASIRLSA